jgi:conjugative transfer region protein TrbK
MMRISRLLACLFLAIMATGSASVVAQQTGAQSTGAGPVTDPLAKELERCKALHEQAANDPGCQAASKQTTRQFFQPPADYQPGKVDMFPKTQSQPWTTDTKTSSPSSGE